ncbi:MAG: tetratricopeptide repeat protein [Oscillatoriales cyanobacterium C42_A2020_001]|nr:tetratricopeptide repeat protein [Leptolyngbyaceae cyanobacterium C42_A2020_001]
MSEKRNRWIVSVVMGLAFLAFVGISLAPLLSGFFQAGPSTATNSPAPTTNASPAARKTELEAQAKGYELVLQREPENPTALRGLLETRLALNDVQGAIAPLEKLVKLNPNESLYAVLLAQAKQQTGDREGAAQTYREVLKTKPGDTNALSGLVVLLVQQNRPEAAISLLQDTLKTATQANQVQPNSIDVATVQMLLSDVYVSQKRYDEAVAIYDEVAKTNKQDFRPVVGKAMVLKQQGKLEEAKPLFTKAAELAPAKYKDQINQLAANPTPANAPGGVAPGSTLPAPPPVVQPSPAPAN